MEIKISEVFTCKEENSTAIVEVICIPKDMLNPAQEYIVFRCLKTQAILCLPSEKFLYQDENTPRFERIN